MKKKCAACGFDEEKEETRESEPWEIKKSFLEIEGHFTYISDPGGYNESNRKAYIYACPQCGTIVTDAI